MPSSDLAGPLRAARRDPADLDAWVALARAVQRRAAPLPDLEADLPALLAAWSRAPGERALAALVLPLLGLEPDPGAARPARWPPGYPVRDLDDSLHDPASGLPLAARRKVDQAPVRLVPAGSRVLGPTSAPSRAEGPAAYVDRYPVTVGRYARFLASTRVAPPRDWDECQVARPGRPVVYVSWQDALAYASWAGAEVPGESLWVKAGRGLDARAYPWGDEATGPDLANLNFAQDGRIDRRWEESLDEVDRRPSGASPWGVEDLVGNVYEWCAPEPHQPGVAALRGCSTMFAPGKALPLWMNLRKQVDRIPNGSHQIGFRCSITLPAG